MKEETKGKYSQGTAAGQKDNDPTPNNYTQSNAERGSANQSTQDKDEDEDEDTDYEMDEEDEDRESEEDE
jgi:hypothetical protein